MTNFRVKLIKKKSIGLVVDTNILRDIIESSDPSITFVQQLVEWIKKIVSKTNPHPYDRTITLFANKQILDDYCTGLSHAGHKQVGKQIRHIFEKKIGNKQPVFRDDKIFLSLRIYKNQIGPTPRRRLSDRSDEKFLVLLDGIRDSKKWTDWAIIIASRDRTTFDEIRDITLHDDRVYPIDSKDKLDQIVEC